jgi:CheY-like chemotaxis protein
MLKNDPGCDLIFTDFQMPMMNGVELSVAARQLYSELNLPLPFIVLCTADYSATLSTEIVDAGIQGKVLSMRGPMPQCCNRNAVYCH